MAGLRTDAEAIGPTTGEWTIASPTSHTRKLDYRKASEELRQAADLLLALGSHLGANLEPGARVLDLGCGVGDTVRLFLERGLDAWGVDIREYWGADFHDYWEERNLPTGEEAARLRVTESDPYRLPFDDDSFDFVVSNQVFEHVQDYESVFRELGRVLRPGGISVHMFPARWRPIEGHVNVPFASVFQNRPYLSAWARLGRRTPKQKGMAWRDVAQDNLTYLREQTNYLGVGEIARIARRAGVKLSFEPHAYVLNHPGAAGRVIRRLPAIVQPVASSLFGAVAQRLMVVRPS